MTIYFYSEREAHGHFSNFSAHAITLAGRRWPTTEHYFQAQKFAGTPDEETVRRAPTPKLAADLGRDRARPLRADWEAVKDDVMRAAVRAKFTQHADLRAALLATGDEELVENTRGDHYWGCGHDGTGKNMLGKILMEVRGELRARDGATGGAALRYVRGDATAPQGTGPKVLVHVLSDAGGWGKGFVLAISRRWPEPEADFRRWHRARETNDFALGAARFVQVAPDLWVGNLVAQHKLRPTPAGPPIRYDALERCLDAVADHARAHAASVHMPRIGCGLAGGQWELIEPIVARALCARGVAVTVYDFA
jgi:ribA/ribD-fused uncharacterized protein